MKKGYTALIALLVGACGATIEEVKQQPVQLDMAVAAPWDRVGTCLASTFGSDLHVLYLPIPSEARAEVIMQLSVTGDPRTLFVFQVTGGERTKVTWQRRVGTGLWEPRVREAIERCGKA